MYLLGTFSLSLVFSYMFSCISSLLLCLFTSGVFLQAPQGSFIAIPQLLLFNGFNRQIFI